ncbi:hypothetical protein POM88_022023 [Heracleum sosnowskyi]|uniref:Helitron helicase-like domain-containing protein n=1 Tax=Heracleum sosnowskyi TaxID=360622 RepID=A0AAD8MUE6_9APIA|nr:hypothetical protein POM88_022023 [Heracleum sosnowskyi]
MSSLTCATKDQFDLLCRPCWQEEDASKPWHLFNSDDLLHVFNSQKSTKKPQKRKNNSNKENMVVNGATMQSSSFCSDSQSSPNKYVCDESIIDGCSFPDDGLFDSDDSYEEFCSGFVQMDSDDNEDNMRSDVRSKRKTCAQHVIPEDYASLGCPSVKCTNCNARMWKEERMRWVNVSNKELVDAVEGLIRMLDEINELVQEFRTTRERFENNDLVDLKVELKISRSESGRENHICPSDEVVGVMVGSTSNTTPNRDIIIEPRMGKFQRVSYIHPKMMVLQYPLLFPKGEDGYHDQIPKESTDPENLKDSDMISIKTYYSYRFHVRDNETMTPRLGGRLFQQYMVDAFSTIEQTRLWWFRESQTILRNELYTHICDSVRNGDDNTSNVGKGVILPTGFVGSKRYMHQNFQDALAVCRHVGHPDVFLTMTTNPLWDEIQKMMAFLPGYVVGIIKKSDFRDLKNSQGKMQKQDEVEISNVAPTTFYLNYKHHSVLQLRRKLNEPQFAEKAVQNVSKKELLTVDQIVKLGKEYIQMKNKDKFPQTLKDIEKKDYTVGIRIREINVVDHYQVYWATNICNGFVKVEDDNIPETSTSQVVVVRWDSNIRGILCSFTSIQIFFINQIVDGYRIPIVGSL